MATTTILKVEEMSCGHCTHAVEVAIGALDGVESVHADLETKDVTVIHDGSVTFDALKEAVDEAGFEIN